MSTDASPTKTSSKSFPFFLIFLLIILISSSFLYVFQPSFLKEQFARHSKSKKKSLLSLENSHNAHFFNQFTFDEFLQKKSLRFGEPFRGNKVKLADLKILENLEELYLYDYFAREETLFHLKDFKKLKKLGFMASVLDRSHIELLNGLGFVHLEVTLLKEGRENILILKHLKNLFQLHFFFKSLKPEALDAIQHLKTLKKLDLPFSQDLKNLDLAFLEPLKNLTHLSLGKGVGKQALPTLKSLSLLEKLSIYGHLLSPQDLEDLQKALPHCKIKY